MDQTQLPSLQDHGQAVKPIVSALLTLLGSPAVAFLLRKLMPAKQEEDAAEIVASAFKELIDRLQSENGALALQMEKNTQAMNEQRGRLMKMQAYMHVTTRLLESHIAALEFHVVQQGGTVPLRPRLPELPDLDTLPLFEDPHAQVRDFHDRTIRQELEDLRKEVQQLRTTNNQQGDLFGA